MKIIREKIINNKLERGEGISTLGTDNKITTSAEGVVGSPWANELMYSDGNLPISAAKAP